jgi:hypothetical protein
MKGLKALLKDFVQQVYNPSKGKCKDADLVENIDRSWSGRGKRTGKPLYYTDYYVYAVDTESVADIDEQQGKRTSLEVDDDDDQWGHKGIDTRCALYEDSKMDMEDHDMECCVKGS